MEGPIQIKVRLEKDDYVKAFIAFGIRQFGNQIFLVFIFLVVITGIVALVRNGIQTSTLLIILFFLGVGVFPTFVSPILIGKKIEKNKDLLTEVIWSFSDKEISIESESSKTFLDWSMFYEYLESKNSFLLVHSENRRMFQIIPKRALSPPILENDFRLLLRSKFGTGTRPFVIRHWRTILFVGIIIIINLFVLYILNKNR